MDSSNHRLYLHLFIQKRFWLENITKYNADTRHFSRYSLYNLNAVWVSVDDEEMYRKEDSKNGYKILSIHVCRIPILRECLLRISSVSNPIYVDFGHTKGSNVIHNDWYDQYD